MTIYISGAIMGIPDNNKQAFQNAYSRIKDLRVFLPDDIPLKIINPLNIGRQLKKWFAVNKWGEPQWADYMRACIKKLCDCDYIFFLPDWTKSEGATMERYIAKRLGIQRADSIEEMKKIILEQGEPQ